MVISKTFFEHFIFVNNKSYRKIAGQGPSTREPNIVRVVYGLVFIHSLQQNCSVFTQLCWREGLKTVYVANTLSIFVIYIPAVAR